tara:strand:+ start:2265 stop:2975 length:711 start_codon:yes stop_codon:yes gene_type:complete
MTKNFIKEYTIDYKKQSIHILIKKNKLSKSYKLTFDKKYLRGLVSIPRHVSFNNGLKFANENVDWLYKEMEQFFPLININHNSMIMIKGKMMKILFKKSNISSIKILGENIIISSDKVNHKKLLKAWLDSEILNNSEEIIKNISNNFDTNIKKIKLSNSYNYWGSCNSNGDININWRLVFSPKDVLKYIITHEICHLIEFNHTKRFWKLVEELCPSYKKQINWLQKNENYLYRIRI